MTHLGVWLQNLSLSRKLTGLGVVGAAAALLFVSATLLIVDISLERSRIERDITTIADIAGINSTGAIAFLDPKAASETLSALRVNQHVVTASLRLRDGRILAQSDRDLAQKTDPTRGPAGQPSKQRTSLFAPFRLTRPIVLDAEQVGTIYVESDLTELQDRILQYLGILGLAALGAFVIALGLSAKLQRIISGPVLRLIDVTRSVTPDGTTPAPKRPARRNRRARRRLQRDAVARSRRGDQQLLQPAGGARSARSTRAPPSCARRTRS